MATQDSTTTLCRILLILVCRQPCTLHLQNFYMPLLRLYLHIYLLLHVLSRSADGAKLPSVGIYLNASKVETSLDMATLMLDWRSVWGTIGFWPPPRCRVLDLCLKYTCLSWRSNYRSSGPKSFVDDLCTGQGVVLGRAATTLRSIETHP